MRTILEDAVKTKGRLKLGSLLANIAQETQLTDEEAQLMTQRDQTAPNPVSFE